MLCDVLGNGGLVPLILNLGVDGDKWLVSCLTRLPLLKEPRMCIK